METKKFKDLEEAVLVWETLKKIGTDTTSNPQQELIEEVKKRFGDADSFMMKFNPSCQIRVSDFQDTANGDYPTIKSVCRTYGKGRVECWIYSQLVDLATFAGCKSITKEVISELSAIIVRECQYRTVPEMLHFFYCIKSGEYVCTDCKISPMAITLYMHQFNSRCNARLWFEEKEKEQIKKCFLIIENQPNPKVYARVFGSKENAEKALEERDYRTGERLYPACHVIERIVE